MRRLASYDNPLRRSDHPQESCGDFGFRPPHHRCPHRRPAVDLSHEISRPEYDQFATTAVMAHHPVERAKVRFAVSRSQSPSAPCVTGVEVRQAVGMGLRTGSGSPFRILWPGEGCRPSPRLHLSRMSSKNAHFPHTSRSSAQLFSRSQFLLRRPAPLHGLGDPLSAFGS